MADQNLQYDQAVTILKKRAEAADDLVAFAKLIDIPSVPVTECEDEWELVETPLAAHHLLTLHALQAMVKGQLLYDIHTLAPITRATPDGLFFCLPETPRGDRSGGGVGHMQLHDPSGNSTIPEEPLPSAVSRSEEIQRLAEDADQKMIKITGVISPFLLTDLRYGVCRRVMIMMPPGSAKSTYGTVVFPVWDMGRVPDQQIILTGWGDPICRKHGKRARAICEQPLYKAVFNTAIDPDTRAAEDWSLMNGSNYKSSGINSGVAGFRCDGLVWDDLTKSRKEADSKTIRDDIYNAYIDDARSRKKPDAWEVGIGTRWHEDEIMGRLLPEGYAGESGYLRCRDGNVWLVICLAAECERLDDPLGREIGEMIWPEWFGEEYWAEKRMNARSWGSLYQQRPAPEQGIFFQRDWFKRYTVLPDGDNYIGLDPAVTDEEDSTSADDTAIQVWRVDEYARLYLMDEWVKPVTMDVWIGELLRMCMRFKPLEVASEAGVIRRAAEPFLKRAMRQAKAFFMFNWTNRSANKPAMARGAQAMVASGQVFVPDNPLGDAFIEECLAFPTSKRDHRVDAFVNLCLRLETIWESNKPKLVEEEPKLVGGSSISIKSLMPPRFPKKKSRWSRRYGRPD
jgi:predicted phage terminase large subunit-like protein